MKKELVKQKALQWLGKMAEFEAGTAEKGWPPPCVGIIYQPKRPIREQKNS